MKAGEIRKKTDAELGELLLELRRKQMKLRMAAASEQAPRSSEIREARKDIARIKTIVTERAEGKV
jgi:large subunit ribosomal protein L29